MKKIALFLLFFAFLFVTACSSEKVDETLKIQYSFTEFTIGVGEEKDLELPIDVNLSVPLNDVIEEKDGIIKGLKEGEVVLTLILIADSNVTKEVKIVVTETVYTITYDLDGGVCEDLVTEFRSYKDVVLKTPSKEGYAFDGWYEGKTRLEGLQENKNYTLTAKWKEAKPEEVEIVYELDYDRIYLDDAIKLSANVLPFGNDQSVTWKVTPRTRAHIDEENVLTFDESGTYEVTAISVADTSIKCKVTFEVLDYKNPYRFMDSLQVKEVSAKPVTSFQSNHNTETYVLGSVIYYLFEDITVNQSFIDNSYGNRPGKTSNGNEFKLRYVTVHDVGFTGSAAVTHNNNGKSASWHFSIGNDGIYQGLPLDEIGYHAGDGTRTPVVFTDTLVKATNGDNPAKVTINQVTGMFEMNGVQTSIKAPLSEWGTIVKNSQLPYTGINNYVDPNTGTYWISNTHWDSTYDTLANYGGNLGSIGIETSVLETSNLYYTWELTAKTIAQKILRPKGLLPRDVKQHNTFSGKDCPMTMRHAGMWEEFMKHVEGEYTMTKYFSSSNGWTMSFATDSEYLKKNGMIDHLPDTETEVSYSVTLSNGKDFTHTFTYTIKLPAKSVLTK